MKHLVTLLFIFFFSLPLFAQNSGSGGIARVAPNFNLEDLNKEIIELNNYIGKGPLLLCFWSSCCISAVAQVEAFSNLYGKHEDEGFMLLAIAVDQENTIAKVKPYVKSKKYKFPVLYDTDGNVSRMYYAFDVPFCVLINKSGEIIYSHLGYMRGDEIELGNKVKVLLNEPE